ncbi:pyruvate carboxyltransferase [Annulohypoxylon bovei var. microspora]|nr:pyruvate carboxyltransferase [Annulohypoxylon bovei var. microspora]
MSTANNPITHHTSHTMGNGASSSNSGTHKNNEESNPNEGEQFATAYFETVQKVRIAQALDDFGVDFIEVTSPAASEQSRADCELICELGLKAKLMKHSHGKDIAFITAKTKEAIEYVKSSNLEVRFSGEDSFRSNFSEILELYTFIDRLETLRKAVSCDIETHFHNDTGCAIANSRIALEAGATHVDTTVLGIGERNGITPLAGLIACVARTERKGVLGKYKLEKLGYLDRLIAEIVGV